MPASNFSFIDLTSADDDPELLNLVHTDILLPTFYEDEYPGFDYLMAGFDEGQLVSVALESGVPVAAAVASETTSEIALLSYLAVLAPQRGRGMGGMLLEHLQERWRDIGVPLVLGEVHDPRFHHETPEEQPMARLCFYESHGCELLGVPWLQPSLAPGTHRVAGMLLIALHRSGRYAGQTVSGEGLRRWITTYYESSAGEVGAGARSNELMDRFDQDVIPVLELSAFSSVAPLGS